MNYSNDYILVNSIMNQMISSLLLLMMKEYKFDIFLNQIYEQRAYTSSTWTIGTIQTQCLVQRYIWLAIDTGIYPLIKLSKKLNYSIKDLIVTRDDNRPLTLGQGIKIGDVPYFQDGAILIVNSRAPKKEVVHSGIKAEDIAQIIINLETVLQHLNVTILQGENA